MKLSIKIFIGITVLLIAFTVFSIINTGVSMKYEVDEPIAMGKISEALTDKYENLKSLLFFLWIFLFYQLIIISFLTIILIKLKKKKY